MNPTPPTLTYLAIFTLAVVVWWAIEHWNNNRRERILMNRIQPNPDYIPADTERELVDADPRTCPGCGCTREQLAVGTQRCNTVDCPHYGTELI